MKTTCESHVVHVGCSNTADLAQLCLLNSTGNTIRGRNNARYGRLFDEMNDHYLELPSSNFVPKKNKNAYFEYKMSIFANLLERYPQLVLPIEPNEMNTPEYKKAVLRGEPVCREANFICSPEDKLEKVETPVGKVDILYLAHREDFEHALRALAYRCEPVDIPASVGANTIRGLINWQKIRSHKQAYILSGGTDWDKEFRRFTANKKNYLDTIILLSSGYYSAIPACEVNLSENDWRTKSVIIRKYHELTHYVCRSLYPQDVEPIRDEVIADMIGLMAAFDHYDPFLAERFLGIEGAEFRRGGRLMHYTKNDSLSVAMKSAKNLIEDLASKCFDYNSRDIFDLMLAIIHEYYGEV